MARSYRSSKPGVFKKLFKLVGIGGAGAAAGAAGIEASGLTAAGMVGGGVLGIGTSAILVGSAGGALLLLAGYGVYKAFKH